MTARLKIPFLSLSLLLVFCASAFAAETSASKSAEQEYKLPEFIMSAKEQQKLFDKEPWFKEEMLVRPEPVVVEDPLWYYSVGPDGLEPLKRPSGYLGLLESALDGNPMSMVALTQIWEWRDINKQYPQFPEQIFDDDYWRGWAARYTTMGWAHAREGDRQRKDRKAMPYGASARAGSPEGGYLYSDMAPFSFPKRMYLIEKSAYYGWPPAMLFVAEDYRTGLWVNSGDPEKLKAGQNFKKRAYYLDKAMEAGYDAAFLAAAFDAYTGLYGRPRDIAKAYYYYLCWEMATRDMTLYPYWKIPELSYDEARLFFFTMDEELNSKLHPDPRKEELKQEFRNYAEPLLTRPVMRVAREEAYATVSAIKERKIKELEEARARRAELTKELRRELAPVVDYLNKRKLS